MFGKRTCSHCHRTFGPRVFGINLLIRRYEMCPFCHKLTEVRYAPPASPERVEERPAPPSEEEALRKHIEESRYEGRQ